MAKQNFSKVDEFFLVLGDFIDERLFLLNEARLRRQALKLQKRREKLLEKLAQRNLKAYEAKRKLARERAAERRKEREKEKLEAQKRAEKLFKKRKKVSTKLVKEKKDAREKIQAEKLRRRFWRKFKRGILSIFVWFHFVKIRRLIKKHEKYRRLVEKQEHDAMKWHKHRKKLRRKKKR